jgi:UDP-N-acetylmuramate-alanine ligase
MKTERALARLASNHLDEVALAEVYRSAKEKIDGIVTQWFGNETIATDALSRVLVRIAKNAVHFCPQFHKSEDFILGHAIQECQRLYS